MNLYFKGKIMWPLVTARGLDKHEALHRQAAEAELAPKVVFIKLFIILLLSLLLLYYMCCSYQSAQLDKLR